MRSRKVQKLTQTAFMLSLITVLSFFESMMPPITTAAPGIRLGLGNIVTMYAIFAVDKKTAFMLNFMKSVFVLVTRAYIAAVLSLAGGMLSILVIILMHALLKNKISYLALSITGAVFHNIGQLAAEIVIMDNIYTLVYLPVLIVAGVIMGSITGTVLNIVMPRLRNTE